MGRLSAVMCVYGVLFGIAIPGVLETGSVASAATGTGAGGLTATGWGFARASPMITRGLPTLVVGSYRGQRPRNIYFSGDAGNIVDNLRWSSWTSSHAAASGWSLIQGCVPDCATGAEIQVPTSITLRDPVDGYFTRIIERRDGQSERWVYTPNRSRGNWPQEPRSASLNGPVVSLEAYWGDIDTGAYAAAWMHLAPAVETKAAFVQGETEARPTNIELLGRLTGISGVHAHIDVDRLRTHDEQYGCRSWSGYYEMLKNDGKWLIANARVAPTAC